MPTGEEFAKLISGKMKQQDDDPIANTYCGSHVDDEALSDVKKAVPANSTVSVDILVA
jgi:hypothetical protein